MQHFGKGRFHHRIQNVSISLGLAGLCLQVKSDQGEQHYIVLQVFHTRINLVHLDLDWRYIIGVMKARRLISIVAYSTNCALPVCKGKGVYWRLRTRAILCHATRKHQKVGFSGSTWLYLAELYLFQP